MKKPRAATPADAKAVWDSMEKAGHKPTVRGVEAALAQSGQFLPVSYGTIQRWKKRGWRAPQPDVNVRKPAIDEAAAKVDAAVPVLTGDPTTRAKDLAGAPPAQPPEPPLDPRVVQLRAELNELTDDALMKRAARESYITAIILMKRVQERPEMVEAMPREVGSLQQALAGSIQAANGGFETLLELTKKLMDVVPDAPSQNEPKPEEDPLADAIDSFKHAERAHG